MAENILINIELNTEQARQSVEKTTGAVEDLKRVNKELAKDQKQLERTGKQRSAQFKQNAELIALNSAELKKLNATRAQSIKVLNTQKGSLNEMRLQLSKLTAERNAQETSTKKGKKRTEELNKAMLKLTKTIKKSEEAGGDYRRSVGNYGNAMNKAKGMALSLGSALGVAGLGGALKSSLESFDQQIIAELNLEDAIGGNVDALKAQASALQEQTTFGDEATLAAQAQLATLGLTADQVQELTPLVQDLAARTGKDLAGASKLVTNALATGSTTLEKYGVSLQSSGTLSENFAKTVKGLDQSVGGFAKKAAKVGSGPLKQMQNRFGDMLEVVGEKLTPAINFLAENFESIAITVGLATGAFLTYKAVTLAVKAATFLMDNAQKILNKTMKAAPYIAVAAALAVLALRIKAAKDASIELTKAGGDLNKEEKDIIHTSAERVKQIDDVIRGLKRRKAAASEVLTEEIKREKEVIKGQQAVIEGQRRQMKFAAEVLAIRRKLARGEDLEVGDTDKIERFVKISGRFASAGELLSATIKRVSDAGKAQNEAFQRNVNKAEAIQKEANETILDLNVELTEAVHAERSRAADANLEIEREHFEEEIEILQEFLKDRINILKGNLVDVSDFSREAFNIRKELIEKERDFELAVAELRESEIFLINQTAKKRLIDLNKEFAAEAKRARDERLKEELDAEKKAFASIEKQRTRQLNKGKRAQKSEEKENKESLSIQTKDAIAALDHRFMIEADNFERGVISQEQFEERIQKAQDKARTDQNAAQIKFLTDQLETKKEFQDSTIQLEEELAAEIARINKEEFEIRRERQEAEDQAEADRLEKKKNDRREAFDASRGFAESSTAQIAEIQVQAAQVELDNFSRAEQKKTDVLDQRLATGLITQQGFDEEQKKLADERLELEEKVFKRQKAADIANGLMSTFNSAIDAFRALIGIPIVGPVLAPAAAGAATAFGLAQVNNIRKQTFEKGGKIGGKRHSQGGTKYYGEDGNVFEAERDESMYILNRSATKELAYLSHVNERNGGASLFSSPTSFARDGGQIATSTLGQSSARAIRETVQEVGPTIVTVEDINIGQSNVDVAESRANF